MIVNYNGSLFEDDEKVFNSQNRAFRYGDGLIETMRVVNGKIPFYGYHMERLLRGMKVLKIQIPSYFNIHYLKNEISKVIENQSYCRVRLALWRGGGGTYRPTDYDPDFLIESAPLVEKNYTLNDLGQTLGFYKDFKMRQTPISPFKTSNALPYVLASIYAKENSLDDVLLLNTDGYITEASYSNVFLIKNNELLTPSVESGCVKGVMRTIVLEIAAEMKIPTRETLIKTEDIFESQEVFLTNAVQGIKWVENIDNQTFTNEKTNAIFEKLIIRTKVSS